MGVGGFLEAFGLIHFGGVGVGGFLEAFGLIHFWGGWGWGAF